MVITPLVATVSTYYTGTFIAYGWKAAEINGAQYVKSQGHSLPSPWVCEIFETNATKVATSSGAGWRANQQGTIDDPEKGGVFFDYKVKTDRPTGFLNDLEVRFTIVANASASGTVSFSGASGQSGASSGNVRTRVISVSPSNTEDSDSKSKTVKSRILFKEQAWNSESDGTKSMTFTTRSYDLATLAVATCSGTGGNYPAVSTGGSASFKFYPSGIKIISSGSTSEMISGSTNSFGEILFIDVFNANNVPLDNLGIYLDSGTYKTSFDEFSNGSYKLYGFAPGSLRKKCEITWDSSTGLSGVDFTLEYGDLDGDNYISQDEVNYINSKIGTNVSSATAWFGDLLDGSPYRTGMADLNLDGQVTSADYNLASPNVGHYGD